jgi:Icc-related predicted phosphoesterase
MRLVYATDLHGDPDAYAALAALARRERAQAVLLGGDLFAYSREAAPQLAFAAGPFRDFLRRLRAARTPVVAIPGNDDRAAAVAYLHALAAAGLLRLADLRPQRLADDGAGAVAVVGYPFVPPTPFRLKEGERRDLATDRYPGPWPHFVSAPDPAAPWVAAPPDRLDRLPSIAEELAAAPVAAPPWVLLAHSPPWGVLDRAASAEHAGSRALRAWILARQPTLALHGHIHEAPDLLGRWAARLGATICVNPGAAQGTAVQAVVCDTAALPRSLRHTTRPSCDPPG